MPKYKVYGHRLEVNHYIINAPTQDEAIDSIKKTMKGKTNPAYYTHLTLPTTPYV